MKPAAPDPAALEALAANLAAARSGRLPWLHNLILAAGYQPPAEALTAAAVAQLFAVTPQAVGLWTKKQNCPRNPDGTYNLRDVIRWHLAQHQAGNLDPTLPPGFKTWKDFYQTQTARIEYQKAVGDLIPREEVEAGLRARLTSLTRGLENIGHTLAVHLAHKDAPEIQRRLDEYINELRTQYAGGAKP